MKRKRLGEAFSVTTIETKDTILKICSERNDEWSEAIRARFMNVHDLPAADAVYHQTCNVNFRTNRQLPQLYETDELFAAKKGKVGRPQNEEKKQAFVKANPRPFWKGMMQLVHQGRHQGKSSVTFLPMIDMNPSDVTCVPSAFTLFPSMLSNTVLQIPSSRLISRCG